MSKDPLQTGLFYALALAAGLIWGVTFSLARIATEAGRHPLGLTFWQAAGGGTVLLAFCLVRGYKTHLSVQLLLQMGFVGMFGSAIPGALLFYAAPHVPVGVLAITIALVPILTYVASWQLKIDSFSTTRLSGVTLGFVAILMVMLPESSLPEKSMQVWVALALLATVFYTLENLFVDQCVAPSTHVSVLLTGGMTIAALALLPIIIWLDAFEPITLPLDRVDLSVLCMMLVSSIAYLMYLYLIQVAGAVFASMSGYVVTLAGVLWGVIIFDEQHSGWIWLALLLMLGGMLLVTPREKNGY